MRAAVIITLVQFGNALHQELDLAQVGNGIEVLAVRLHPSRPSGGHAVGQGHVLCLQGGGPLLKFGEGPVGDAAAIAHPKAERPLRQALGLGGHQPAAVAVLHKGAGVGRIQQRRLRQQGDAVRAALQEAVDQQQKGRRTLPHNIHIRVFQYRRRQVPGQILGHGRHQGGAAGQRQQTSRQQNTASGAPTAETASASPGRRKCRQSKGRKGPMAASTPPNLPNGPPPQPAAACTASNTSSIGGLCRYPGTANLASTAPSGEMKKMPGWGMP